MSELRLLAIETSSATASIALAIGNDIAEQSIATPREQTQRILGIVDELLGDAGLKPADLDALVFGRGPGSFTGLRVAAAVTQGLSLAAGCPIVPVSSLAGLAQRGMTDAGRGVDRALCIVDARMGEVYSGWFRLESGLAVAEGDETIGPPEAVKFPEAGGTAAGGAETDRDGTPVGTDAAASATKPFLALGDGLAVYAGALTPFLSGAMAVESAMTPRARDLLPPAMPDIVAGRFVPLAAALPVYLRQADAWRRPRSPGVTFL